MTHVTLTLLDHLRASSCSCLAATIIGSLTISPAFCSGNSSSFSSGGGGLGGGTSPSGSGGFGGACSSLTCRTKQQCSLSKTSCHSIYLKHYATLMTRKRTRQSRSTNMQLIQVWGRRRKVRLLRLEGFSDFPNSRQDPVR